MKILFVFENFDKSEFLLTEQTALREKYELHVLAKPNEEVKKRVIKTGGTFQDLNIKHRLDFSSIKKIKDTIKEKNIDLIYAPSNKGLATSLFATKQENVPIVTYRGTLGHLNYFSPVSRLAHLNKRVSGIACNCNAVKYFLKSLKVPDSKLHKIYKGHDSKWYENKTSLTLDKLNIPKCNLNICTVANIRPLKGIDLLLKAIKEISKTNSIHLTLIGENRDKRLIPLMEKLGIEKNVMFLGYRDDATSLMQLFDVNCIPSVKREGLARSVVEAQLQGIPAIVSDTGGLPEIVENKKTGIVVQKNNVGELIDAIKFCLNNKEELKTMGIEAKKYAEIKFSTKTYLHKMFSVFDTLTK